MALHWSRKSAGILVGDDPDVRKKVKGRGTGNWIVHKSIGSNQGNEQWTITHTPTGRLLSKHASQQECIDLVEHMSRKVFGFTHLGIDRIIERSEDISKLLQVWIAENHKTTE